MRIGVVALVGSIAVAAFGCSNDPEGPFVALDQVDPAAGSQLGGQRVTITGEGFINGAATPDHVLFGEVLAETVTVVSDTELEVITPSALAEGSVDVTVFNSNGFTVLADGFSYHPTPVVTALSPDTGNRSGGEDVTITGSGFLDNDAGATVVLFGDTEAGDVTINSDTEIVAKSPKGTLLKKEDIVVTNANGSGVLDEGFQFVANGLIAATGGGGNCGLSNSSQLLFIDLDTGEVVELAVSNGSSITGLATLDDGRVVAMAGGSCCGNRELFFVDVTTGERELIAVTKRCPDITSDGTTVFSCDRFGTNSYGTLDLDTGEFTSIGGTSFSSGGFAIRDDGTHFHASGNSLRIVNPADGTESDPPVNMAANGTSALTFHRGKLYDIRNQSLCFGGGSDLQLFEVNETDGTAVSVASLQARVDAIVSADRLIGN